MDTIPANNVDVPTVQSLVAQGVTSKSFDERLDLLHTIGELSSGNHLCATAEIRAFVRRDSPQPSIVGITALLPKSEQLKGKVALVIGGSRGLGAAISQALVWQGCSVLVNYRLSKMESEQRGGPGNSDSVISGRLASENCSRVLLDEYPFQLQAQRYANLYKSLV